MTLHTTPPPPPPQKLNVSNIFAVTDPILMDETLKVGSWEHLEQILNHNILPNIDTDIQILASYWD